MSLNQIAAKTGRVSGVIYTVLLRQGVEMRNRSGRRKLRELTKRQRTSAVRRYESGESIPSIARDFACSTTLVAMTLDAAGVERRKIGQQPWKPTKKELAQLFDLYNSGVRVYGISRALGHGGTTIERVMREHGIEPDKGPLKGPRAPGWAGGRVQLGKYTAVWIPDDDPMAEMRVTDRYVLEHRLVMARSLGRPLTKHETVHHINGDPVDNRIENLQLRTGRHGKGVVHECADCGSRNIREVHL
jgi:hypothetical protein